MRPDTVFPSWDGDSPGEQEQGEDISGMPLSPLSPEKSKDLSRSFVDSEGNTGASSHISSVPGRDEGLPPRRESTQRSTAPEGESEDSRRNRRTAPERISQLTKRWRAAETRSDEFSQQVQSLQQTIQRQQREIENLSRRPPQAAPTEESYASFASQNEAQLRGFDRHELRQVVEEAIAPIRQQQEERNRRDELQRRHQLSFADAAREMPQLADVNSEEYLAFSEVWQNSPLQNDPDGPFQVALMVKGLLADERQEAPMREARKRAARVVTPGPQPIASAASSKSQGVQRVYDEGMRRFSTGDESSDTYIAIRKAMARGAQ